MATRKDARDRLKAKLDQARRDGKLNIAAAINIGNDDSTVAVYADDDVTIVQRDGETEVTRRRDDS